MNSFDPASFNVQQFDELVKTFYEGSDNSMRQRAQVMLTDFQNSADSWQTVDQILERSTNMQAKFIALGVLEDFIKLKWNLLPMEQRLVIRNYIVRYLIDFITLSSDESTSTSRTAFINKLDIVLVQIMKKDWPQYWPTCIQEIVNSSSIHTSLCENNMKILRFLSEEVFDYSIDFMTVAKKTKLKTQMLNEYGSVFDLCKYVLSPSNHNSTPISLIQVTFETLLKILSWIPSQFLYQQGLDLIDLLNFNIKSNLPAQRNLSIQCLVEIINNLDSMANDDNSNSQYDEMILSIYKMFYTEITNILPKETIDDIIQTYEDLGQETQELIKISVILFTTILSKHRKSIENINPSSIQDILSNYLLKASCIRDKEIWGVCLEYWGQLANDVLQEHQINKYTPSSIYYYKILEQLGPIMIDNMVKPDEVLMIEDTDGEITREFIKQSDTTSLSKTMQHVFKLLTRINPVSVHSLINEQLSQLLKSSSWSWDLLFHICWAVGASLGATDNYSENQFLETILVNGLLPLLRQQEGMPNFNNQDQEWVIASCILYVTGQCPYFLTSHLEFTNLIMQKIFAYMQQQTQPGIREMACDAFLKIAEGFKEELSKSQQLSTATVSSILESALSDLHNLTASLDPQQLCTVYEAICTLITASSHTVQMKQTYFELLMKTPNEILNDKSEGWTNSILSMKVIINMIRVNIATCKRIGFSLFRNQIRSVAHMLFQYYKISSQEINSTSNNSHTQRLYITIRKLILHLFQIFVISADDKLQTLLQKEDDGILIFELLQIVFTDYRQTSVEPEKTEADVLSLLTSLVEILKEDSTFILSLYKDIIDIEYSATLPMITSNFVDYPEIRHEFYKLLHALNQRYFTELLQSSPELFQLNVDSILWGTKHTTKDISEMALRTCLDIINYASQMDDEDLSSFFFETYYVKILTGILEILIDPDCRNAFDFQTQILSRMLELVQEGEIYARVFDHNQVSDPLMSNVYFLQHYVLNLLCSAFPLLQKEQIDVLVRGMFEYSGDLQRFQDDIRDFLIDIKEVDEAHEGEKRAQEELNAELDLLRNL
ncbi:MAG: armadillo-type protein [Benjaminiella poitrasii]|nr:MAG: armadillo-type protein [Benjaminiella poitrasii]